MLLFSTNGFFFPTVTVISRSVHPKTSTARDRSGHWTTSARWTECHKECQIQNVRIWVWIEYQLLGIIWSSILFLYIFLGFLWGFHIYVLVSPRVSAASGSRGTWGLIAWSVQEGAPVRAAQAKLESLREAGSHGNILKGHILTLW